MEYNELYHHGIKGMKWGVRRYQNEDGTYTNAGKKRYNNDSSERASNFKKKMNKALEPKIKVGKDKAPISAAEKISKETGNIVDNTTKIVNSASKIKSAKNRNKSPVHSMSDQELRATINRMQMEQTYESLSSQQVSRGMAYTTEVLGIIGSAVGIAGSAIGIITAIKTLKG